MRSGDPCRHPAPGTRLEAPEHPALTKLIDADLLQLLPGEVGHQPHGVVAAAHQLLVVLRQPQSAQPLQQVRLEQRCRSELAPRPHEVTRKSQLRREPEPAAPLTGM